MNIYVAFANHFLQLGSGGVIFKNRGWYVNVKRASSNRIVFPEKGLLKTVIKLTLHNAYMYAFTFNVTLDGCLYWSIDEFIDNIISRARDF